MKNSTAATAEPANRLAFAYASIERRFDAAMASANIHATEKRLRCRQLGLAAAYAQALADMLPAGADKIQWTERHDRLARESYDLTAPRLQTEALDTELELPCTCGLLLTDPGHRAQHQRVLAEPHDPHICGQCAEESYR